MLAAVVFPAVLAFGQDTPAPSLPSVTRLLDVVRTTVAHNPNVSIQRQQVEFSKGALQQASGQFDETVLLSLSRSRVDSPISSAQDLKEDITAYTLSLSRQLRSGITLSPSLSLSRTKAISPAARQSLGADTANQAAFSFSVTVPLLKGRGEDVTAANEKAAKSLYEADVLLLNHSIAQNVFNAVRAYWAWVAAVKRLAIFAESERRAQVLLGNTRKLIEHDQRPASSIDLVEANLSSKRGSRIFAEQDLADARKELGLVMGLNAVEIAGLGAPSGNELAQEDGIRPPGQDRDRFFIELGLAGRSDLKSLLKRQEAANTEMIAAKKNILHQLDLNLQAGYNSLTDRDTFGDYFTAYGHNMSGLNTAVSLKYRWPVRNNEARGFYVQQKANYEKSVIDATYAAKTVSAEVANTLSSLRKASLQLTEARAAVLSYRRAVESENRKFTLGMSTLNDVITNENFLVSALLDEVASLQNVAGAIIALRVQTGAIILPGADAHTISLRELTTVPETAN